MRGWMTKVFPTFYERIAVRSLIVFLAICLTFVYVSFAPETDRSSFTSRHLFSEDNETVEDWCPNAPPGGALYPPSVWTDEERAQGWVVFHCIGILYMFIALAIVCDEYFVPCLEVIVQRFNLSDDVAGATFMAAGGSAPEFFTSLIGVFVARSNVGFGTIIGSAVFNVLFVLGACSVVAKNSLQLTWWPLSRDASFYAVDLVLLSLFFLDNRVQWWESMLLVFMYVVYVIFMVWNEEIERLVKSTLARMCGRSAPRVETEEIPIEGEPDHDHEHLSKVQKHNMFRAGVMELMLHEVDPIGKGPEPEKENRFKRAGEVVIENNKKEKAKRPNSSTMADIAHATKDPNVRNSLVLASTDDTESQENLKQTTILVNDDDAKEKTSEQSLQSVPKEDDDDEEPDHTLVLPKKWWRIIIYVLLLPISVPLYLTVPDTRRGRWKKGYWFIMSFVGSVLWIAVYSYFMVWWSELLGQAAGIDPEVMGLTILAAGTSIPDLITSVLVTRQGYGDMAVSSSIGSNIFDVTVGLPLPWFLFSLAFQCDIIVDTEGLGWSVFILLLMLVIVVVTIACLRWKMNKIMGIVLFIFYAIFLTQALLIHYVIDAPF